MNVVYWPDSIIFQTTTPQSTQSKDFTTSKEAFFFCRSPGKEKNILLPPFVLFVPYPACPVKSVFSFI